MTYHAPSDMDFDPDVNPTAIIEIWKLDGFTNGFSYVIVGQRDEFLKSLNALGVLKQSNAP